jgi:hypothetical protein
MPDQCFVLFVIVDVSNILPLLSPEYLFISLQHQSASCEVLDKLLLSLFCILVVTDVEASDETTS